MKTYTLSLVLLLLAACNTSKETSLTEVREPVARIIEYTPAPGQFINEPMSGFDGVDTPQKACDYVVKRFAANNWVSLGGFGGYIVTAFEKPVQNSGKYELYVVGNPFNNSSEPGVVWVMTDANGDGIPNDTWYELKGSEYKTATRDYQILYKRPNGDNQPVVWSDNKGNNGTIDRVDDHRQATYYPKWIDKSSISFVGTRLPDNIVLVDNLWTSTPFKWGYADNYSSDDRIGATNRFRISDAVTGDGQPANLLQIDFVKVQSGINTKAPLIGEISTEVCNIGCYRTITKAE